MSVGPFPAPTTGQLLALQGALTCVESAIAGVTFPSNALPSEAAIRGAFEAAGARCVSARLGAAVVLSRDLDGVAACLSGHSLSHSDK